jgi:predicted nucleotidyltransferase
LYAVAYFCTIEPVQIQSPFRTVTTAVDGEILAALARADHDFTVGELHVRLGRSTEGVRRALDRLVEQGIVTRRSIGRATSYQLNREHVAAPAITALAELPTTLRNRIRDHIAVWSEQPFYGALFGSVARQEMRPDSDIDILLVTDDADSTVWDEQIAALTRAVGSWTGNDVRPLVFATDEIRGGAAREPVLREIAAEGVTIAGGRGDFTKLVGL